MFGINELRLDEVLYFGARHRTWEDLCNYCATQKLTCRACASCRPLTIATMPATMAAFTRAAENRVATNDNFRFLFAVFPPGREITMDSTPGSGQGTALTTSTERSRLLLEINNAVVSHLELAPLLKSISECLRRELPHDFAGLAIYDPEIGQLRVHGLDFSAGSSHFSVGQIVPIEGTPAGLAFTSRQTVLRRRPDAQEFPSEVMKRAMDLGVKSGCVVPLICHGQALGTLAVASFREAAYSEADAELLSQIGTQVAIAVQNVLNFGKLQMTEREVSRARDRTQ